VKVFAIINPVSGAGMDPTVAQRRVALIRAELERRSLDVSIALTERSGHARELAEFAVDRDADVVIVWGGDGTVNEAGSALLGSKTALGLVRAGSGNGLAAALGVPRDPRAAVNGILDGTVHSIDAGLLGSRPFFNVAGIGFDAHVAALFNQRARGSRGRWPYVSIGVREGCRYRGREYEIELDGNRQHLRAFLMVFANGQEFGMGARIAPGALLDDGLLDATIVEERGVVARFWDARHLAFGTTHRAPRVHVRPVRHALVRADGPIEFHVDGEPGVIEGPVEVKVVPGAVRIAGWNPRVPASSSELPASRQLEDGFSKTGSWKPEAGS
jgi:diacylglycerol kinase (ATP)